MRLYEVFGQISGVCACVHTFVYEVESGGEEEQMKSEARSMRGMMMNLKERENHLSEHKAFKEPIAMLICRSVINTHAPLHTLCAYKLWSVMM